MGHCLPLAAGKQHARPLVLVVPDVRGDPSRTNLNLLVPSSVKGIGGGAALADGGDCLVDRIECRGRQGACFIYYQAISGSAVNETTC